MANLKSICLGLDCFQNPDSYTKQEVNDLIAAIEDFEAVIVNELPATGEAKTIYFLRRTAPEVGFTEWMYIGGNWEEIGDTTIDLSNYYTKSEIDTKTGNIYDDIYSLDTRLTNVGLAADAAQQAADNAQLTATDANIHAEAAQADATQALGDAANAQQKADDAYDLADGKQDALVSGTNIKTVNNESLLGTGNVHTATLETQTTSTSTGLITATIKDDDNELRFDVAGDLIEMDFVKGNLQNTRFLVTPGVTDNLQAQIDAIGDQFRVKQYQITGDWTIPACTTDPANTAIPKITMTLTGDEATDYAFVGMIAYEVFDAKSGGNRLNFMTVCQFTGNGQTELSVRGCVMGSSSKTARRISCWALLRHR